MRYLTTNEQSQLEFATKLSPDIADDECLIKVKCIGVNRADILQKQGKYPPPQGESDVLGIEVSGEIHALGANHTQKRMNWAVGDRVFAIVPGGAYAQYVKVNISHLFKLPEPLTFAQGAGIAEVFLTAYQCLFSIAQLKNNSNVLIHAGASGVGSAAIQLAKQRNCHVTVTVGNAEKVQACLDLGADIALNYNEVDFSLWAKEHKPKGFDVILDVVAGDYISKNINVCALDGHIVILSMLGGRFAEKVDVAKLLFKRINIHATTLRNRSDEYKAKLVNDFHSDFYQAFSNGSIKPIIHQASSWQQAEQIHQLMMNNENIGKLILIVD